MQALWRPRLDMSGTTSPGVHPRAAMVAAGPGAGRPRRERLLLPLRAHARAREGLPGERPSACDLTSV